MNKTQSQRLLTFLYLLCLYLAVALLPLSKWVSEAWLSKLIELLLKASVLGLTVVECRRVSMKDQRHRDHPPFFYLLLLLVPCCSNFLWVWFQGVGVSSSPEGSLLTEDILLILIGAAVEELLFRFLLLTFFEDLLSDRKHSGLWAILFSSLAFSLMHMINFFGSDPLLVLGQLGYTFLLGIILAILSLTYETPYLPILGHSLFNLLNLTLFTAFFSLDTDLPYYLYSGFLGIFFVGYAFLLYNLPKKKTEA